MKWFEIHLNWAAFLGLLAALVAAFILFAVVDSFYDITEKEAANWTISIVMFGIILIPFGWVLKKKRQAMWWLVIAWVPFFGWILPIMLPKKTIPSS